VLEHDRFEELASLEAIGELSPEEHEEFLRHKKTCQQCRELVAQTTSLATTAFLSGTAKEEDAALEGERHRRLRDSIARNLPAVVPVSLVERYKHRVAAGIAAAFLFGAAAGAAVGFHRALSARIDKTPVQVGSTAKGETPKASSVGKDEKAHLQTVVAELQKRVEETVEENHSLQDKLTLSDQHTTELETRLTEVEKQSNAQSQEVSQAHNDLSAARNELAQAKESIAASQTRIDSLQYALADKEARLTEVSASVERERQMLSQGREVRDIMGARDLHIVDVIDRDGMGRARKAFGRAFYPQGKSLIFYAFDLPAKNTADGKFVYAAWGSNSNHLNSKSAHSLGIFYNDDQTQHRWAMKFDDPKLLEEIDTVFVTLEPADRSFTTPTGKPILEAYFGTPPNHP
jgi:anti-sigma factor RsiW